MKDSITILGTNYKIVIHDNYDNDPVLEDMLVYVSEFDKIMNVLSINSDKWKNIRPESRKKIIYNRMCLSALDALYYESGFNGNVEHYSGLWIHNERCNMFFVEQFEKIKDIFSQIREVVSSWKNPE